MGQPTPPGDIPLVEGLGPEWNEFVSYVPEDKRAEFGPKLKERISGYESLKPYEDFAKSGVSPEQVNTALSVLNVIDSNPREVYEAIGKHLNITPAQAKEVVKEVEKEATSENPTATELETLRKQVDTLGKIMLATREQETQEAAIAEQQAAIDKEIKDVQKKYGDIPEDQIVMRMIHKEMTADQAAQEYLGMVAEIQKRRPAPYVLGNGGHVPAKSIDVTTLDSKNTKNLVAQMLQNAVQQEN